MKFARALTALGCSALLCFPSEAATKKKKPTPRPSLDRPAISALDREDDDKPAPGSPGRMPSRKDFHLLQPGELPLKAPGAVVLDAFTGQMLYGKDADTPQFPASTTKVMTALLVIENGDLDHEVEITPEDSKVGESSLELRIGERYTRRQMLFGLMLKSANDVAHSLGRDNAGSIEAFALKMTQRARELGATNTSFRNPHGLHHLEHYTSPHDLALIARYAMQQPMFRRIVSTQRFVWQRGTPPGTPAGAKPELWQLTNHNRLLTTFDGCTGVKTGYTNPAQHTLVSAALRDGREVIATVMHDGKYEKGEDSKLLLTYGFDHPPQEGN